MRKRSYFGNAVSIALKMDPNKSSTANCGQVSSDGDADGLSNYQEILTYGIFSAVSTSWLWFKRVYFS